MKLLNFQINMVGVTTVTSDRYTYARGPTVCDLIGVLQEQLVTGGLVTPAGDAVWASTSVPVHARGLGSVLRWDDPLATAPGASRPKGAPKMVRDPRDRPAQDVRRSA